MGGLKRCLYVGVVVFLDWHVTLAVAVMGTALAAALFLFIGVVANSQTELT